MLLQREETKPVQKHNISGENSFTIKTTAKAYEILSSGIYTLPIEAIVRELSCNAYDSHVAANNISQPYDIHLPTITNPSFIIRDYGTGLSSDDVFHLYTTYFESTKTNSNDFIGALGLGSKSPFSYTKAFRVISYFNGMKYIYAIFLNDKSIPSVACLGSFPTEEHNGLCIEIEVKHDDIKRFIHATKNTLRFFPIKPNIIGYDDFTFDSINVLLSNPNKWMLVDNSSIQYKAIAVQGNVQYRIELSKIQSFLTTDLYKLLMQLNTVLLFENGEIDFSSSREEIRYDDNTISKILERISDIESSLVSYIVDKSMQYESMDIVSYYNNMDTLLKSLIDSRNGAYLKNFLFKSNSNVIPDNIKLSMYIKNNGMIPVQYNNCASITTCQFATVKFIKVKKRFYKSDVNINYSASQNPLIVLVDSTYQYKNLTKKYIQEHKLQDSYIVFVYPEPNSDSDVYNDILQYFSYIKISDLIVKYPTINNDNKKVFSERSSLKKLLLGYSSLRYTNFYLDTTPLPRFYIDINNKNIIMPNGKAYTGDNGNFIKNLLEVVSVYYNEPFTINDLVGVMPSGKKHIANSECINIVDVVTKFITDNKELIVSGLSYLDLVSNYYGICTLLNKPIFLQFIHQYSKKSLFYKFYKPLLLYLIELNKHNGYIIDDSTKPIKIINIKNDNSIKNDSFISGYHSLLYFIKLFCIVNSIPIDIRSKITYNDLLNQYPLLDAIKQKQIPNETFIEHLYEYIMAIDKKK